MNHHRRINHVFLGTLLFLALACVFAGPGYAQAPIASIVKCSGTVAVLSGDNVTKVERPGQFLMSRDMILTEKGKATIRFNDNAIVELGPYSLLMIQEGMEKKVRAGEMVDTMKPVRRITSYVGKARFKSGSSKIRNCVQTPTAVCAISGSEVFFGTDCKGESYLQVVDGFTEMEGNFLRGYFENPGIEAAEKCRLYQEVKAAADAGDGAAAMAALVTALGALLNSPDLAVRAWAVEQLQAISAAGYYGPELAGLEAELVDLEEALQEEGIEKGAPAGYFDDTPDQQPQDYNRGINEQDGLSPFL